MADQNYPVPENPTYDSQIRALQDSDPARASSIFNPLFQKLIENTHAVKLTGDKNTERIEEVEELLTDHNTSPNAHEGVIAALKSALETHIGDTTIHVTAEDKALWNEITTHERKINSLTSDLASLAFDFAMSDLSSSGGTVDVFADKIKSADDVIIISGQYADGKVFI